MRITPVRAFVAVGRHRGMAADAMRTRFVPIRAFSSSPSPPAEMKYMHQQLYESVLSDYVPEHGWTQEAVAAAVRDLKLPLTFMGAFSPSQLVHTFMQECNQRMREELLVSGDKTEEENEEATAPKTTSDRIVRAIQLRLEMVSPLVRANRWHEGMALGASPSNCVATSEQVQEIVSIVVEYAFPQRHTTASQVERTAIGALYVATELHMLGDTTGDGDFERTWQFLRERVQEYETGGISLRSQIIAGSAVASSLAGAAVSLAQPAVQGIVTSAAANLMPLVSTWMKNVNSVTNTTNQGATPTTAAADDREPAAANNAS